MPGNFLKVCFGWKVHVHVHVHIDCDVVCLFCAFYRLSGEYGGFEYQTLVTQTRKANALDMKATRKSIS